MSDTRLQTLKEALAIAEAERLKLSTRYSRNLASYSSPMNGNLDWAKLEGAVRVVEAIRALVEECPQPAGSAGIAPQAEQPQAQDEREAFENTMRRMFGQDEVFERDAQGCYVADSWHDAWIGWQARAAMKGGSHDS